MPNVTRDEYAILQKRTQQGTQEPVQSGWKDGALTIFVPGKPTHYKGKGHRYAVSQHTKRWREATASRLLEHGAGWATPELRFIVAGGFKGPWPWKAEEPKRITFTVYTSGRGFDGPDNIRLVCSPVLDACGPRRPRAPGMGLIDDDKNPAHRITYEQVTKAPFPGIAVRVELVREAPEPSAAKPSEMSSVPPSAPR